MQFLIKKSLLISSIAPQVTWGTSPEMVVDFDGNIPDPELVPEDKIYGSKIRY